MADINVLDVHFGVGEHVAGVPEHRLRGYGRDADVHNGLVEHADYVHHRHAQAAQSEQDAGDHATRVLVREYASDQ